MTTLAHAPLPAEYAGQIDDIEWQARCELAALYRLIAYYRMTDLIDTHLTLRIPDGQDHFLINHYGIPFECMRASDLVRIDHKGSVVDRLNPEGHVNTAGFVIHSAVHMARPELSCVIHTHTAAGMAVAAQQEGLLPITQHALRFYGHLAYHEYEGIALDLAERERLVADLGRHRAMILRNHGLLVGGRDVPEAFMDIYFLERACQAQIQALSGGRPLHYPDEATRQHTAAQFDSDSEAEINRLAWQAALTLIADQHRQWCS
ncbi:ribulose-5-phosphate 4-epimerase/fuculose-1-phosphate aldolase [Kushneria sinocarnis]|uniref:Ribulose-5-phosphate 4-epimerase/fuculose-1-phosphate aldolase n=1 Tax=Kushneria sinocarnis TaxID=595502 RepID=A0A420WW10_9GAMM|nr:class II aldolase/adducin family protein [Kushneria sinocarnis]RKR03308.1 ribulose-5-phosphate 4-epimerase/fuculose-1-phosphate aldolase [Kushneria sinocarnis]